MIITMHGYFGYSDVRSAAVLILQVYIKHHHGVMFDIAFVHHLESDGCPILKN